MNSVWWFYQWTTLKQLDCFSPKVIIWLQKSHVRHMNYFKWHLLFSLKHGVFSHNCPWIKEELKCLGELLGGQRKLLSSLKSVVPRCVLQQLLCLWVTLATQRALHLDNDEKAESVFPLSPSLFISGWSIAVIFLYWRQSEIFDTESCFWKTHTYSFLFRCF